MIVLIPTAKQMSTKIEKEEFQELTTKSKIIVKEMASKTTEELAKLYKIKIDKAQEELENWKSLNIGKNEVYKAIDLFDGLMYRNIKRKNLEKKELDYLKNHVFITSSLYGVIPIDSKIARHRLDFLQNIKVEGFSLKKYWQEEYNNFVDKKGEIVSLLSSEFEEVFSKDIRENFVKISFIEEKEGKYRTHSTISKKARGRFVTELMKRNAMNLGELKKIEFDGYKFAEELSEDSKLVFVSKV